MLVKLDRTYLDLKPLLEYHERIEDHERIERARQKDNIECLSFEKN